VVVYTATLAAIFALTKAFAPRGIARPPQTPLTQNG
jgi:hypothetical protein